MSEPFDPRFAMAEAARFLAAPQLAPSREQGGASDLSIDGVLLLGAIGWEAVELVTGISCQVIPRGAWIFGSGENAVVTEAHQQAIAAAAHQLAGQCATAGGHGVVGVELNLETDRHRVSAELVGTAIRPIGSDMRVDAPFTSDLSARDFVVLSRSGWEPVGLCFGVSFVFVPRFGRLRLQAGNFELENYTQSLYNAREQAMERMQAAAIGLGASGVIGTNVVDGPMRFASHAMSFIATGTATRLGANAHSHQRPMAVLPLDNPEQTFEARALRK